MRNHIENYFDQSQRVAIDTVNDVVVVNEIIKAAQIMINALSDGKKIMSCGNGGSMSDAMHFASELTGRYRDTRDPIAAIALSDPGAISCIANDFGYDHIFRRQIIALGNLGDVLLAISTSGKSANVLRAIVAAKQKGMPVIALTGQRGISMPPDNPFEQCDVQIKVPSSVTNLVQECHIKIIHVLVELIEQSLNPNPI